MLTINYSVPRPYAILHKRRNLFVTCAFLGSESKYHLRLLSGCIWNIAIIRYKCLFCDLISLRDIIPFLCTSEKKILNFHSFHTRKSADLDLARFLKKTKVVTRFNFFLKLVHVGDYLGKIGRNSKLQDSQPIFEISDIGYFNKSIHHLITITYVQLF